MKPGLEVEPLVSIIRTAAVNVGARDYKTAECGAGFNCNFSHFKSNFGKILHLWAESSFKKECLKTII